MNVTHLSPQGEAPRADEHARRVSGMFGRIEKWYDPLNHILSGGLDKLWRACLADSVLMHLVPDEMEGSTGREHPIRVLDLAAGTLDVALAVHRRYPEARIPALDFCPSMLEHGKSKLGPEEEQAIWPVAADARALPLPDGSMDGIAVAFGIRNILPREEAFAEMARVLAPGGRLCVLEFGSGRKRIWCGLYNLYLFHILPRIGRLFGNGRAYRYLADSIRRFPDAESLQDEMRAAGFSRVYHVELCSGIVCLHVAEKTAVAQAAPQASAPRTLPSGMPWLEESPGDMANAS